jgi:DedD protein
LWVVQVKERLTGAIILVALIVLLVPELLTGPVHSAPRVNAVAPSAEEPPLRSYTIKLADEAHPRGAARNSGPDQPAPFAAPPVPGAATTVAQPSAEEPTGSAVPPPAPGTGGTTQGKAAAPAAAPAQANAAGSGAYVVQLGSFASRANADRLARQLHSQGFPVSVSQGSSGHLYRVRVGPVPDRGAASELAQHLRAHGHSGAIVPQ